MITAAVVRRKFSSFLKLSLFIQIGFIPCWLLLGIARASIFIISFKHLAPKLGIPMGVHAWVPLNSTSQQLRAVMIRRLIGLTARYTPWDSNCFPQAVVARFLLGFYNIPYALFFGLRRDEESGELKAHAWVVTGRVFVTGGQSFSQFTVVGCYVTAGLTPSLIR
jgi:hypothetical protein